MVVNKIELSSFSSNGDAARQQPKTVDVASKSTSDIPERETWGSRAEFLLSCVGLSVGIGNVWRFPYLAYQNGGGAFLLPYTILLILIGKPMYFMELALGQYSGLGPLSVWRCSPVAFGVGAAMVMISLIVAIYYTVIVAYTVFYLCASFAAEVPWASCGAGWADERCYQRGGKNVSDATQELMRSLNTSINGTANETCTWRLQTASEQYWSNYVLHINEAAGIGYLGNVRWDLALCLLLTWIIVFFCLFKGIQSSGKAVYFTATFPYVILLILFFRGVTLEGASTGIKYFFLPQWDKLLTITAWTKAAEQMFYSLSISWGGLIMFGSYSNFKTRIHVDALIVSSLDFITSIIAGVVIFSVLGALSIELNRDISEVVKSGPGLAFVAYPEALARLPVPQLWSVLFFFMLFTLGLDSEFSTLETVLTAVYDEYPMTRKYKPVVCLVACIACFLLGLPCVTNGGQYVLELMDNYGGGFTVLVIGAMEMIAMMWIYGVSRFCADIEYMLGFYPNLYWRICWVFCCPCLLLFLFIFYCVQFTPPKYGCYEYPTWGHGIGWGLLLVSIIQIPLFAIIQIIRFWRRGDIKGAFRPDETWGPNDSSIKEPANIDFPDPIKTLPVYTVSTNM